MLIIRYFVLLFMLCILHGIDSSVAQASERAPNIIYLFADDLGYAELGCYGQEIIKTPNIDRLAEEGMMFTQHYSGSCLCAPSRCCLMTGKHTGHTFARANSGARGLEDLRKKLGWKFPGQKPLPEEEITLAEILKAKGYATAAAGKWGLGHVGTSGDPNRQGFDQFYGFNCQVHAHNHYPRFLWRNDKQEKLPGNNRRLTGETYSQDKFTEFGLEFIRQNKDKPFFLYMPFAVPHLSIQVPEKSLAEYKGKLPEEDYKHTYYLRHPFPRAGYAAMISHLDRDVGKIMAEVKRLGLDSNTLIMFSSDNGPTFRRLGGSDSEFFKSAGKFRGLKGSLYEGGIRVPLIARWPGKIKPKTVSNHISAAWDIFPTVAELSDATAPKEIDGISFAATLLGSSEKQTKHEALYWELISKSQDGQQAIRFGDWKAIRQKLRSSNDIEETKIQLYNLAEDISEQNDLADKHPEIVERAARIMKQQRVPSKEFPFPKLDNLK